MKMLVKVFRSPASQVLVFLFCLAVFIYPVLLTASGRPAVLFSFLFAAWFIVILILRLMSRAAKAEGEAPNSHDRGQP